MLKVLTNNKKEILVSSEIYEIAKKYKWVTRKGGGKEYAFTYIDGKKKSFGQIVFGLKKGQFIFHKNGDTFDYTNQNIILCNRSQLGHYISISKEKTSGLHGVHVIRNKFEVKVVKDKNGYSGGIFKHKEDAAVIADCISIELYGENALRNLPEVSYEELLMMKSEIFIKYGDCFNEKVSRSQQGISTYVGKKTSKYVGVSKNKNKWESRIKYKGNQIRLGYFDSQEKAAREYDMKAIEIYGKYARTNFPIEDYAIY